MSLVPKIIFPKKLYLGHNSLTYLETINNEKKLAIVSESLFNNEKKRIKELLGKNSLITTSNGEPSSDTVNSISKSIKQKSFDHLIVIGGGSVIDTGKLVNKALKAKFVAIPSTIGSGAECSRYAVFTNGSKKIVEVSEEFLPDVVILTPEFVSSIKKHELIYQSIDAFSHALEALVSKMANPFSDKLSLDSIISIYNVLTSISKHKNPKNFLTELQIASFNAGLAQSSVGTGLVHALAHILGPKNSLPHSSAIGQFLIEGVKLNKTKTKNYDKLNSLGVLNSKNFVKKFEGLFSDLGVKKKKLKAVDLDNDPNLIRRDITMLTNPYLPTSDEIKKILKKYI